MTPHNHQPSGFSQFLSEMRRRHVVRFAIGYAAAAFVVLQLAEIVFPAFGLADIWLRLLVIVVALGFPPAVVLAWVFDLTPQGLKRTEELPRSSGLPAGQAALTAKVALVVVTFFIVGGVGVTIIDRGALTATAGENPAGESGSFALTEYDPTESVTSLAVLPLDDFSEEGGQEYFTSGMQEELITQLSQIPGLRVVSRTSVAQFAGTNTSVPVIGQQLGVDAIIEGSVLRSGDRVRITVQLIHASSDTHIWSERYDRDLTDILTLQSEVAYEIVRAIQGEISPEDESRLMLVAGKSIDPTAQEAYLRGKQEFDQGTPAGYNAAMGFFQEAVEADPEFAPALAGMAGTRFLVTMDDPDADPAELEQAHEEARRAYELDPSSEEVREVFKLIEDGIEQVMPSHSVAPPHEMAAARTHVISVPGMADSIVINVEGFDSAWVGAMTRLGSGLERRVLRMAVSEGETASQAQRLLAARRLLGEGQFPAASSLLEELVDEVPGMTPAWEMLVRSEVADDDSPGIVAVYTDWQEAGEEGSPDEGAVGRLQAAVAQDGMRGYWSWTLEMLQERNEAGEPVTAVQMASAHAGLGHTDEALMLLADGLRNGDRGLLMIQADPVWDDLRSDPRFQQMARQIRALRFAPTSRRPGGPGGPTRN